MKFKNEELFEQCAAEQQTMHGKNTILYAKTWAELMEKAINEGLDLPSVADNLSHEADTTSISGAQFSYARQLLEETWAHGEALKEWYKNKRKGM